MSSIKVPKEEEVERLAQEIRYGTLTWEYQVREGQVELTDEVVRKRTKKKTTAA